MAQSAGTVRSCARARRQRAVLVFDTRIWRRLEAPSRRDAHGQTCVGANRPRARAATRVCHQLAEAVEEVEAGPGLDAGARRARSATIAGQKWRATSPTRAKCRVLVCGKRHALGGRFSSDDRPRHRPEMAVPPRARNFGTVAHFPHERGERYRAGQRHRVRPRRVLYGVPSAASCACRSAEYGIVGSTRHHFDRSRAVRRREGSGLGREVEVRARVVLEISI